MLQKAKRKKFLVEMLLKKTFFKKMHQQEIILKDISYILHVLTLFNKMDISQYRHHSIFSLSLLKITFFTPSCLHLHFEVKKQTQLTTKKTLHPTVDQCLTDHYYHLHHDMAYVLDRCCIEEAHHQ